MKRKANMGPQDWVVYEDDALVVFNKPAGLLIAPDRWDKTKINLMGLIHDCLSPKWFNAHRLDRDTSGIIVVAKTKPALDDLCTQFEERLVTKEYVALVRGRPHPPEDSIVHDLEPDRTQPGRMLAVAHGKRACTRYAVREVFRHYTWVALWPETGRQHQLRVHLALRGCPIVGDRFYGDGRGICLSDLKQGYKPGRGPERPLLARLALHAARVTLKHPVTLQPLTVEAPLPDDLELVLHNLRRYGG